MNWDELASPETPILRSDSLIGSRQPSQTSMDFREGVTMQRLLQSACCSCVRLRARHPFVPAKSRSAPPRAIVAGAKPARSCAPCPKRPRARHMLRRRRNVSSVTGARALRDNPTLQGRQIVLSVGGLSCSWEWPDTIFRDAVGTMIVKGDAPPFLMPRKDDFDSADSASDMLTPDRDRALSAHTMSSDDRERGRSSALFLAKSLQADTALADI
jgi:hypothetical protein